MSIRLLLADDQELVRTGFRLILNAEPDMAVVGEAADGSQAVDEASRLRPDVVLMDVRMPGMDGIAATRRLGTIGPEPPRVIMLTTFDLDQYVYEALRAGASGSCSRTHRQRSLWMRSGLSLRATRCWRRRSPGG